VCAGAPAKLRRSETVATAKGTREVWRLAVADQLRDVAYADRRLLGQQLRRRGQPPRAQVLLKARLAELRVGALHLAGRARHRAGNRRQREAATIVARDDHAREQIQPPSAVECVLLHALHSDRASHNGTSRSLRHSSRRALLGRAAQA
jgi:hypothetical protein